MIKLFDQFKSDIILYHGTDVRVDNPKYFKLPMWLSKDWFLSCHFALNPRSSSRRVDEGYVYKLRIINPVYEKIDDRRILLNDCENISILQIDEVVRDPMTFARIKNTLKENLNIDPYGEENWDDDPLYKIGDKVEVDIGPNYNFDCWGIVTNYDEDERKYSVNCYRRKTGYWKGERKLGEEEIRPYRKRFLGFRLKENLNEDPIDPYGEEIWIDIIPDPINWRTEIEIGDKIYYHYDRNGIDPAFMGEVTYIVKSPLDEQKCYVLNKYGEERNIWHEDLVSAAARIIKKSKVDVNMNHNESVDIDPYGEENWEDKSKIKEVYDMLTLGQVRNVLRDLQLLPEEEDIIIFKIDYPRRGILSFTISENMNGEITLYCNNIISIAKDSVVLNSLDPVDFWDKLANLVETNIKPL